MRMVVNNKNTWWALLVVGLLGATTFVIANGWGLGRLSAQEQVFVHCYEEIRHEDGNIGYLGHPPMTQKFQPDPGDTHVNTHCFINWADAAEFISGGAVKLPASATQKEYEQATLEWSTRVYQEQLKAQQQ
jgi:hypothetical protein